MSKGRGVGFFEAGNFYPDFVLWVLDEKQQSIAFVDPKGIRNLHAGDPKIQFYQTIKTIEKQLGDPDVTLNSFIISNTPYHLVKHWDQGIEKADFENKHILFQDDANYVKQIFQRI